MNWTTTENLREQVRKLWDKGRLLACLIEPGDRFPLRLTLRTPTSTELSARFDEVRKWSHELQAQAPEAGYRLVLREVRHRIIGANSIPHEAWIDSLEDAIHFIGKGREVNRFAKLLASTRAQHPQLVPWLRVSPHRALLLEGSWDRLLQFITWLKANPKPGIFLRQVDLPGLNSKFIETQRPVLSELLDLSLDPEVIDENAVGPPNFARRYGFRSKPIHIRVRGLLPYEDDVTLTAQTFASLDPPAAQVFITENEINFLSFPAPGNSLVLFGSGYGFEKLARVNWLQGKALYYWGDIDTHGFAILDQLRTHLPQAQSLMMDRDTLLAHRAQWGTEDSPISRDLIGLNAAEGALYNELRRNIHAHNLRLEQERIAFGWVERAVMGLD